MADPPAPSIDRLKPGRTSSFYTKHKGAALCPAGESAQTAAAPVKHRLLPAGAPDNDPSVQAGLLPIAARLFAGLAPGQRKYWQPSLCAGTA